MGQSTRTTTLKRSGNSKGEPPQMCDRLPLRSLKNGCEGVLPEEDPFMPKKRITFNLGSELQVQQRDGIECSYEGFVWIRLDILDVVFLGGIDIWFVRGGYFPRLGL